MTTAPARVVVARTLRRPIRVVAVAVAVGAIRLGGVTVALAVGARARDGTRHGFNDHDFGSST